MFWFYFKRSQKNRSKIYGSYFELYNDFVNLSIENNKLFWYFLCFLIFYALFCVVFTFDLAFSALCFGFWHTLFWFLAYFVLVVAFERVVEVAKRRPVKTKSGRILSVLKPSPSRWRVPPPPEVEACLKLFIYLAPYPTEILRFARG